MTRLLSKKTNKNLMLAMTFVFAVSAVAEAQFMIQGQSYSACGNKETLLADFANPAGTLSNEQYSGLVLVTVKGTGQSPAEEINDAFHIVARNTGELYRDQAYYQLVTTIDSEVKRNIDDISVNQIVYDMNYKAEATPPYVPSPNRKHRYSFVIDMSLMQPAATKPTQLRVGLVDGNYADNAGQFKITVQQLALDTDGDEIANPCDDDDDNDGCLDVSDANPLVYSKTEPCNDGRPTEQRDAATKAPVANELAIAPNPARQFTTVQLDKAPAADATLMIHDQLGKLVHQQVWPNGAKQLTLDLANNRFSAGLYTVQVADNAQTWTKQLTIVE
jgi:hypothetical protein